MTLDLEHAPTLGLTMMDAFAQVARRNGVWLEGIEDDANEHSLFWQEVARFMLSGDPATAVGEPK